LAGKANEIAPREPSLNSFPDMHPRAHRHLESKWTNQSMKVSIRIRPSAILRVRSALAATRGGYSFNPGTASERPVTKPDLYEMTAIGHI
jgi:hypothetical protein